MTLPFTALYPLQCLEAPFLSAKGPRGIVYLFLHLCLHRRSSVMTHILASRGVLLDKAHLHSGRSTRWKERCAPTWSSSSTSISQHCMTFELTSSMISLDLSTTLDHSNPAIGPFHCLYPSPDVAAPVSDIRGPLSPTMSEGLFPHGQGVLRASSIYFRIYTYLKDHL